MTEMKLAISNIAWDAVQDEAVYGLMKQYGFSGLEIAPTRIFPDAPYSKITEARQWSFDLKRRYGFTVPSIQSIWYGRKERLFGSAKERQELMEYTKKAIMFAAATECRNLVFGCPKNRTLPDGGDQKRRSPFSGRSATLHMRMVRSSAWRRTLLFTVQIILLIPPVRSR